MSIVRLSIAAHERAIKYGGPCPHEREDLMHLPMCYVGGVPVFDESRMRVDQVEELEARLNVLAGNVRSVGLRQRVAEHMESFGRFGLRLQDVGDATDGDHRLVRKYLNDLVAAGKVRISEEPTRGKGSARKRYTWADDVMDLGPYATEDLDGVELTVRSDRLDSNGSAGVIHHGTAMGALQGCTCGWCSLALKGSLEAETLSAARKAGGSGFNEGVEFTTQRRLAAQREFERALARGEAMKRGRT